MSAVMQPSHSHLHSRPHGGAIHRKPIARPGPSPPYSPPPAHPPQHAHAQQTQTLTAHSRTRTTSSGIFPIPSQPLSQMPALSSASAPASASTSTAHSQYTPPSTMHSSQYPSQYPPTQLPGQGQGQGTRRTLSNATSSTSSTTGTPNRSNSGNLRRSSSSRSGPAPSSYVALMRKQKATVWCDRAQYEDPRMLAAQRAAKMRANVEVAGGPHHMGPRVASSSSSVAAGVRSKITHRAPKASLYAPTNIAGTGVPMRLSATEVDEGDSEDNGSIGPHNHRSGSGRSSLGSGRRQAYSHTGRLSTNSSPPNGHNSPEGGMADLVEEATPVPDGYNAANYFEHTKTGLTNRSGSSGERDFGDVGQMPTTLPKVELLKPTTTDLRRKGSVDERTTTMSNTRLFIANPDLSD